MTDDEKKACFEAMNPLVNAFFDHSEALVEESGMFLPYGGVLMSDAELKMLEVSPDDGNEMANPRAMVPVIQEALRGQTSDSGAVAVGTAELVILEDGGKNAIKVYAEHRSGFAMVFYLPWGMGPGGTVAFEEIKQLNSDALVGGWG